MNYLKKIYKPFIYVVMSILFACLIITILGYFNILSLSISTYVKIISTIIIFFIMGINIGKNTNKKGYLEGIKFSLIPISIMLILSISLKMFKPLSIIYYLILILACAMGSMLGINKKSKN